MRVLGRGCAGARFLSAGARVPVGGGGRCGRWCGVAPYLFSAYLFLLPLLLPLALYLFFFVCWRSLLASFSAGWWYTFSASLSRRCVLQCVHGGGFTYGFSLSASFRLSHASLIYLV